MSNPSLVLVPGAWHQPACFDAIAKPLEALGYTVHRLIRPSIGSQSESKALDDDVIALQELLNSCLDNDEKVLIVAHSAGGFIAPSAIQNLSLRERAAHGKPGGVIGLALIAAFLAPTDGLLFPELPIPFDGMEFISAASTMPKNPAHLFYNDLPKEEAEHWVSRLLPTGFGKPRELTYEGWRDVPIWYLICTRDNSIKQDIQEGLIKAVRSRGADVREQSIDASHSPFLSMPNEVVTWIEKVIREAEIHSKNKA